MNDRQRLHDHDRPRAPRSRRGSVLVEFAMVSFVLYLLFVVLLDLGRASLAGQTVQGAAKLAAQELARAPLPATFTFEQALADPRVTASIYDEGALVVPIAGLDAAGVDAVFAGLPVVNQALRPLMIDDVLPDGTQVLRYPGALVSRPQGGYTVFVPQVTDRDWSSGGAETLRFRPVLEEVRAPGSAGHFGIDSGGFLAGFVNVRVHYPFQAGTMTAYDPSPGASGPASAALAEDGAVTVEPGGDLPSGYATVSPPASGEGSVYAGTYGLGAHYLGPAPGGQGPRRVRPFRRVLSGQHAARREVIVSQ
jgi:hypothetical protein